MFAVLAQVRTAKLNFDVATARTAKHCSLPPVHELPSNAADASYAELLTKKKNELNSCSSALEDLGTATASSAEHAADKYAMLQFLLSSLASHCCPHSGSDLLR